MRLDLLIPCELIIIIIDFWFLFFCGESFLSFSAGYLLIFFVCTLKYVTNIMIYWSFKGSEGTLELCEVTSSRVPLPAFVVQVESAFCIIS